MANFPAVRLPGALVSSEDPVRHLSANIAGDDVYDGNGDAGDALRLACHRLESMFH